MASSARLLGQSTPYQIFPDQRCVRKTRQRLSNVFNDTAKTGPLPYEAHQRPGVRKRADQLRFTLAHEKMTESVLCDNCLAKLKHRARARLPSPGPLENFSPALCNVALMTTSVRLPCPPVPHCGISPSIKSVRKIVETLRSCRTRRGWFRLSLAMAMAVLACT